MRLPYFKDPTIERVAARILTAEEKLHIIASLPRSKYDRDIWAREIEKRKADIVHFENLIVLWEMCNKLGVDTNNAICHPDDEDYNEELDRGSCQNYKD